MKIKIDKVGKIFNGEIDFPGLSVIAGVNDTGKSTIGKITFALIKALNFTQQDSFREQSSIIVDKIIEIKYILDKKQDENGVFKKYKDFAFWRSFLDRVSHSFLLGLPVNDILEETRKEFVNIAPEDNDIKNISNIFNSLQEKILVVDKEKIIKSSIERFIKSEFNGEINNAVTGDESSITFIDNSFELHVDILKDEFKISTIPPSYDINPSVKEVSFIESPVFLQMWDILKECGVYGNKRETWYQKPIAMHLKDFAQKIDSFKVNLSGNEISDSIKNIIGGEFYYDKERKDILFKKDTEKKSMPLNIMNTAIGVRSFGILDILLKIDVLRTDSLLIVDEPETHLHPEWQVKYAELLVNLVNDGKKVLVTTHSPYMLQALRFFTQKKGIYGTKTKFYLSQKQDDFYSNILDVGDNLDSIFKELSSPMDSIID